MSTVCFECGRPAEVDHHVVPRSQGGIRTVPLCSDCHTKAHHGAVTVPALTRRGLQRKRAKGERVGTIPYGYHLATDGVSLEPDAAELATIRQARELKAAGLSLRKIGERLTERGMFPRTGGEWHASQVAKLLQAEVAA